MIINVEKNILMDGQASYKLVNIEGIKEETKNMFFENLFTILNLKNEDVVSVCNTDDIGVCLVSTSMVDNGDYDWDENYIPYWEEELSYRQILFCPFTGEKFEIKIIKENDLTKEQGRLLNEIDILCKKRKSKKRDDEIFKLNEELFKLISDKLEINEDIFKVEA